MLFTREGKMGASVNLRLYSQLLEVRTAKRWKDASSEIESRADAGGRCTCTEMAQARQTTSDKRRINPETNEDELTSPSNPNHLKLLHIPPLPPLRGSLSVKLPFVASGASNIGDLCVSIRSGE